MAGPGSDPTGADTPRLLVPVTLFDSPIPLESGSEWHSDPIPLTAGAIVKVHAESNVRFYAGFYPQQDYEAHRRRSPNVFPFKFGSDQILFDQAYTIRFAGDYRIVLRVGGWTSAGTIQLTVRMFSGLG